MLPPLITETTFLPVTLSFLRAATGRTPVASATILCFSTSKKIASAKSSSLMVIISSTYF